MHEEALTPIDGRVLGLHLPSKGIEARGDGLAWCARGQSAGQHQDMVIAVRERRRVGNSIAATEEIPADEIQRAEWHIDLGRGDRVEAGDPTCGTPDDLEITAVEAQHFAGELCRASVATPVAVADDGYPSRLRRALLIESEGAALRQPGITTGEEVRRNGKGSACAASSRLRSDR